MQRVDDVTGEPIRLSATERERQREAMVHRLHELTQANNALYARIVALEEWRNESKSWIERKTSHAQMDVQALEIHLAEQGVLRYQIQTDTWHSPAVTRARSLWQRLRWLVTGI